MFVVNCHTSISIDHDRRALEKVEAMEAMEACRQTKRKRYSAVGETEVDQEELLQSAKKRSREDVDDEVGGWRDVDDELDGWRDDLDKSF